MCLYRLYASKTYTPRPTNITVLSEVRNAINRNTRLCSRVWDFIDRTRSSSDYWNKHLTQTELVMSVLVFLKNVFRSHLTNVPWPQNYCSILSWSKFLFEQVTDFRLVKDDDKIESGGFAARVREVIGVPKNCYSNSKARRISRISRLGTDHRRNKLSTKASLTLALKIKGGTSSATRPHTCKFWGSVFYCGKLRFFQFVYAWYIKLAA